MNHVNVETISHNLVIIHPLTEDAREWVGDKVETKMWLGSGFVCETRYADDILFAMEEELA